MAAQREESPFELDLSVERKFALTLRKFATKIGSLIARFPDLLDDPGQRAQLDHLLGAYSEQVTPWANAVSRRVIGEVERLNKTAWRAHSARMGRALRQEILNAPTGHVLSRLQAEQVRLIKSLPTEAGARVHRIAQEALINSDRASSLVGEIMRSGDVTRSRATLIARTETSRVSSNLTQARAQHVGSVDYAWQTSRDSDVRESHAAMQGKTVLWSSPPTLDGLTGHAGCLPNCRCYPEPRLPEF